MKKNRLFFLVATLVIGVVSFFSCQKEEATNEDQGLTLKNGSLCAECVPNWIDSKVTLSGWVKWNKPDQLVTNTFLEAYNDAKYVNYRVYRTNGGTFDEVRVNGAVIITQPGMTTYSWKVSLAEVWHACDQFIITVELRGVSGGVGRTNDQQFVYLMREKCPGCTESFNYVKNNDGTYTFTYTPAEDKKDQLVVFTFAQGTAVTGLDGWATSGSTRHQSMSFTACTPVSWTVTMQPDCSGNSDKSNVWTDFKVGDVSKKGSLPNIVINCPN